MIYTVLNIINVTNTSENLALVQAYDETDLTNLLPTNIVKFMPKAELIECISKGAIASNFEVIGDSIRLTDEVATLTLPDSALVVPEYDTDDVWHLLHLLSELNIFLLVSHAENTFNGFTDREKTYIVGSKNLRYSSKHANCSVPVLIEGTYYMEEDDCIREGKRWTSYNIVKDNVLVKPYLTVITTKDQLDILKVKTKASITVVNISDMGALGDEFDDTAQLLYCIINLSSIPLCTTIKPWLMNTDMQGMAQLYVNQTSMFMKALKAFAEYLSNNYSEVTPLFEREEVFKSEAQEDTDVPMKGVKFAIVGQASVPSLNACIKALKDDTLTTFGDLVNRGADFLPNSYNLNELQSITLNYCKHLIGELLTSKNPVMCYNNTIQLYKYQQHQREVMKARLTYIRSLHMSMLPDEVFQSKTNFSKSFRGRILTVTFGIY